MARRRSQAPALTLFPFLSVLAAVMGTLILVIAGMSQIALANPKQVVELEAFDPKRKNPIYVECRSDGIIIHPETASGTASPLLPLREMDEPDGPWGALLLRARLDPHRYISLLVRPGGAAAFSRARQALASYRLDIAYEPLFGTGDVRVRSATAGGGRR